MYIYKYRLHVYFHVVTRGCHFEVMHARVFAAGFIIIAFLLIVLTDYCYPQ